MKERNEHVRHFTVFQGEQEIIAGDILTVTSALKPIMEENSETTVLIFEDKTGTQIDLNLRGTLDEALTRQTERFQISREKPHDTNQKRTTSNKPGRSR